jgi:ribonuclease HIII
LRKGVSDTVKSAAKQIVEKYGPDALGRFAKMHFRTSAEVLQEIADREL